MSTHNILIMLAVVFAVNGVWLLRKGRPNEAQKDRVGIAALIVAVCLLIASTGVVSAFYHG